jgi:hypothetical protein
VGPGEIDYSSGSKCSLGPYEFASTLKFLNISGNQGNLRHHGNFVSSAVECDNQTALESSPSPNPEAFHQTTVHHGI